LIIITSVYSDGICITHTQQIPKLQIVVNIWKQISLPHTYRVILWLLHTFQHSYVLLSFNATKYCDAYIHGLSLIEFDECYIGWFGHTPTHWVYICTCNSNFYSKVWWNVSQTLRIPVRVCCRYMQATWSTTNWCIHIYNYCAIQNISGANCIHTGLNTWVDLFTD